MVKLEVICLLVAAGLTAIAIYVQVNSSALSLPIAVGPMVLTILLPWIAAANFFYSPVLRRISQQNGPLLLQQFLLPGLHILQGVLTVVLVTLSFQGFLPGRSLRCNMEGNWQRLWSSHDGRGIERIQDAFNCCGLNSIKDRAWPQDQCPKLYNRHSPCAGPWQAAMQRNSGLEFAVATVVGILQLIQLVLFRLGSSRGGSARKYKQITQRESASSQTEALLDDSDGSQEDDEADRPRLGYGAVDDRRSPRVEPSHLGDDRNHWVS